MNLPAASPPDGHRMLFARKESFLPHAHKRTPGPTTARIPLFGLAKAANGADSTIVKKPENIIFAHAERCFGQPRAGCLGSLRWIHPRQQPSLAHHENGLGFISISLEKGVGNQVRRPRIVFPPAISLACHGNPPNATKNGGRLERAAALWLD